MNAIPDPYDDDEELVVEGGYIAEVVGTAVVNQRSESECTAD